MNIKLPDSWLVIGSGSMVGSRLVETVGLESELYGAGSNLDSSDERLKQFFELDITNSESIDSVLEKFPGKFVINFAGATIVDQIEKTRDEGENSVAYKVNVLGTRLLAQSCKKNNKFPIFISTDFVFDGADGPYDEDSAICLDPNLMSYYGYTKALAEEEIKKIGGDFLILRIAYPYRREYPEKSDFARNFLTLYDAVKSGEREGFYPIFADQTLTPTYIDDFGMALLKLVESGATGIYHLTSPIETTPYDFCLELLRVARGVENPEELVPKGSIVEFQETHPELAKRPINGGLKSEKITELGFTPTNWKDGIRKSYGG